MARRSRWSSCGKASSGDLAPRAARRRPGGHRHAAAADADDDGQMRALLAVRIATVSGFVKILTEVIAFGATADGMQVPAAIPPSARALAEAPVEA
jgi:hypothetical protein